MISRTAPVDGTSAAPAAGRGSLELHRASLSPASSRRPSDGPAAEEKWAVAGWLAFDFRMGLRAEGPRHTGSGPCRLAI